MAASRAIRPLSALAECVAVAAVYIAISIAAVTTIDLSFVFPDAWSPQERSTGNGFLVGALVQFLLVLLGAYALGLVDLRKAIARVFSPSTRQAWTIAAIATAIHIGTGLALFLPQPERVWEASSVNLILSAACAPDGWSQEVFFRGYVLARLARGGVPALAAILMSGALFAAIHIGYVGDGFWATLMPLVGTFMLGSFFAWAVHSGGGSLKPVVIGHVLIVVILQPWLALAR